LPRLAVTSVEVTFVVCIAVALGVWTVIGSYYPGQTGRGLVLIAVGIFALATAVWSRVRGKKDEDL